MILCVAGSNEWTLRINHVQAGDKGVYQCEVDGADLTKIENATITLDILGRYQSRFRALYSVVTSKSGVVALYSVGTTKSGVVAYVLCRYYHTWNQSLCTL